MKRVFLLVLLTPWALLVLGACSLLGKIPGPWPGPTPCATCPSSPPEACPSPSPNPSPSPVPPAPPPAPTPTPPPSPAPGASSGFPQGVPDSEFQGRASRPVLGDVVNRAMADLTGCDVGTRCEHGMTPHEWQRRVYLAFRARGYAAGEHREGESDEIAVRASAKGVCVWEAFHVSTYSATPAVVWASTPRAPCAGEQCPHLGGGAYRGDTIIPERYCAGMAACPGSP